MKWRVNIIFICFFLISAAVVSRLVFLQILQGDLNKALSYGLYASFGDYESGRGEVYLKNGEPLAINIDLGFVFANPKKIQDAEGTAQILSDILGLDYDFVFDKLSLNTTYSLVKKKLSREETQRIKELDIEGIFLNEQEERYYPQENLASQIAGFYSIDGFGQYGVEQYYDEVLKGRQGLTQSKKGSDIVLTIDYAIQYEAEKLLGQAREDLDIEGGEILVVEPSTGKILAMADASSFDPNYYEDYALEIFKNRATQELFEPGSVFKAVTMAAALEEERVTPQTTYTDTGSVLVDGHTIYNYDKRIYNDHDPTMTEVLEKSINTGSVFVQQKLGPSLFLKYVEEFGFFEPSGIDMQEIYSVNKELRTARDINLATASFGQGIEMTLVQLAKSYCAIANGGKLLTPFLAEKFVSDSGEEARDVNLEKQVISSKTASQLTAMLVSVVENGFAKSARIPGYFIAGKTGTAQVSYAALGINKQGYSDKTIQSFVGFAPAFNPRFLIIVKLDNPKTKTSEYSTVPIFKNLSEYIINYYQIPPDYE